jgi:ribosome-associated heat shock protein Hsp15
MCPADSDEVKGKEGIQRFDKWLWFARLVKSRTLAASLIESGKFRINRVKVDKPSQSVKIGDVITSSVHREVRVYRVVAPGSRRGPATEAVRLYEDLTPRPEAEEPGSTASSAPAQPGVRVPGAGRPTKRERRQIDRLLGKP